MLQNNFMAQVWKGKNEWWRYLLTILLIFIGWQMIGIVPISILGVMYSDDMSEFYRAAENSFMGLGIPKNTYFVAMIFTFIAGLAFLFLGIAKIHQRKLITVLTSRNNFDWKRFFYAAGIWSLLAVLAFIVDYAMHPQDFTWNFQPVTFIILSIISVLLLPFQTSFEEILFRGYFMQGIGGLAKNRWVPLLLTSLGFGLLHFMNPEVEKLGSIILLYYIGTGLLFGMVTLADEGLELALGMHAANNIIASLLVTYSWGVFQTDALWIDHSEPNLTMAMYIPLLIIYPIVFFIFYKKYRWSDIPKRLFGKVQRESSPVIVNSEPKEYSI